MLEIEQRLLQLIEQILGFLGKCLSRAPASFACCLTPASDSVLRKMIGTPRYSGSLRNSRIKVRPSITGILRSVTTMLAGEAFALTRPSAPLSASTT
jgi:hypothetical protein